MNDNKQVVPAVRKPSYEPVTVQVNEIAPMALLCASGGGGSVATAGLKIGSYGTSSL